MKDIYDDFLNKLVILEKKNLLYSHDHDFLDQSASDLMKVINELHKITPKIRIAALGDNLAINDLDYSDNNPKASYLAHLLSDRGIFSISLNPGIGANSIQEFLNLLNSIPKKSKLLYHLDIQLDLYNINAIEIEEMDYSSVVYGYEDEMLGLNDTKLNKNQIKKALQSLYPKLGSGKKDQLILMAMEEMKKMSEDEASDYILGLSEEVVSAILKMLKEKENPSSPSLVDLLKVLENDKELTEDEASDRINQEYINKLMEKEPYEMYLSDDYSKHLQNLLAFDLDSINKLDKIDLFDKGLVNKTILKALINLYKSDSNLDFHKSFLENIHSIINEFIDLGDFQFIHSLLNEEVIGFYLRKETPIFGISKAVKKKKAYKDIYIFEILKASGPKNINWLLDSYLEEEDKDTREDILKLVFEFGEVASVKIIEKIISDQIQDISLFIPLIKDNYKIIPRSLVIKLLSLNIIDAKLLAINILLTQEDEKAKGIIDEIIQGDDNILIYELLDLIKEYKIKESIESLVAKIKTFYISKEHLKYILKTIDTVSVIDKESYQGLSKGLMKKWFSLSPKNLKVIKKHLIGVSYE